MEIKDLAISLSHIKRHQDDAENFQNLSRWVQLNVMADHKAKQILSGFIIKGNDIKLSTLYGEGWSCLLGEGRTSQNKSYRSGFLENEQENTGQEKKITYQQFDIIDWNLVERVLSKKSQLYKVWFSKHHSGWCAYSRNMKRWKYWDKDKCPCCLTKEENQPTIVLHVTNQK